MQNRFFKILISLLRFLKQLQYVQNEYGSVRFKRMPLGSDIIVTYYSCTSNSWVVNLQQILQTAMLNQLCMPDFDTVVNKKIYILNSVLVCFKKFFICTLNAGKVIFVTFFNCWLHTVSVSERMSNFWTVRFLNRIRTNFWFSAHPYRRDIDTNRCIKGAIFCGVTQFPKGLHDTIRQCVFNVL